MPRVKCRPNLRTRSIDSLPLAVTVPGSRRGLNYLTSACRSLLPVNAFNPLSIPIEAAGAWPFQPCALVPDGWARVFYDLEDHKQAIADFTT